MARSIPDSCRSRSRPGSARPRRSRALSAGTSSPRAGPRVRRPRRRSKVSSTSDTSTPRGLDGTVKRIVPVRRVLERAGEDLAARHVAPAVGVDPRAAVDAQAQVGARRPRCGSRVALESRSTSRCWRALSSPQAGSGSSRSRNSAPVDELRVARARSSRPAGRAPASARASRTSAAPAAPRGSVRAPGRARDQRRVDPRQRAGVRRRVDPEQRVDRLPTSASSSGREAVEVHVRRVAVEVLGQLRRREPDQRPRLAVEQRAVQRAHERRRRQRAPTQHLLPGLHLEAPVAEQRRERVGVGMQSRSRRLQLREVLGDVCAERVADELALVVRGHPVAREQLLLARDLEPRDRPRRPPGARTAARSRAARRPRARRPPPSTSAYSRRARRRQRAAQRRARCLGIAVLTRRRRRASLADGCRRPTAYAGAAAARSSCARTSPVTGSAWPAQAIDGSSAASLRIDARACSVSTLKAGCGTRAAPLIPVCGSSV